MKRTITEIRDFDEAKTVIGYLVEGEGIDNEKGVVCETLAKAEKLAGAA